MRTLNLSTNTTLIAGREGYFLVPPNDQYVAQSLIRYGEYNHDEAMLLSQLIATGDSVVEVGANIGSHTVGLAQKVGPTGAVYAYEPQRFCYSFLQSQIALNQLAWVHAYQLGVGAQSGKMKIPYIQYNQKGNFGGVNLIEDSQSGESVDVIVLDDHLPTKNIKLIKIDVEGMELEVLMGARQIIGDHQPILYVENDRVEKSEALLTEIFSHDYQVWWHLPPLFSKNNFCNETENIFGNVASFNVLCIPKKLNVTIKGLAPITSANEPHPLRRPS